MDPPWKPPPGRGRRSGVAGLKIRFPAPGEHGPSENDHHLLLPGEGLADGPLPPPGVLQEVDVLVLPLVRYQGAEGVVVPVFLHGEQVVRVGESVRIPCHVWTAGGGGREEGRQMARQNAERRMGGIKIRKLERVRKSEALHNKGIKVNAVVASTACTSIPREVSNGNPRGTEAQTSHPLHWEKPRP